MRYLNERINQECVIVECTSETLPYCTVEYDDKTKSREHRACLKRIYKATHTDTRYGLKCRIYSAAAALTYLIVEYEDGHKSRGHEKDFIELTQ